MARQNSVTLKLAFVAFDQFADVARALELEPFGVARRTPEKTPSQLEFSQMSFFVRRGQFTSTHRSLGVASETGGRRSAIARHLKFAALSPLVIRERANPQRIGLRIRLGLGRRRQFEGSAIVGSGSAPASSATSRQCPALSFVTVPREASSFSSLATVVWAPPTARANAPAV